MTHPVLARTSMASALLALTLGAQIAQAQSRVQYGRITNAVVTTETSSTSRNVGTLVGGGIGLASGSGQSGSNRALRTIGGGAAGRGIGNLAGRSQAFEYTVLIDGRTTIRIISDQAGKRVGDCVAVEQGQFNNIRLVADSRCSPPPPPPRAAAPAAAPAPTPAPVAAGPAEVEAASACDQAKQQVLDAETDEAFTLAERRMRLLCGE
jgi:outer membrane lipoprotein SlyB